MVEVVGLVVIGDEVNSCGVVAVVITVMIESVAVVVVDDFGGKEVGSEVVVTVT